MYNKKIVMSDATIKIATNLKNSCSLYNYSLLFHKIYHVAKMKIEAL